MRIMAQTRFKQADIVELLRKLGWSQSELARRAQISAQTAGKIISLQLRPTVDVAQRIQNAFADAGEFIDILELWPETFRGFGTKPTLEQIQEVEGHLLEAYCDYVRVCDSDFSEEDFQLLEESIMSLDEKEQEVIRMRMNGKTLEQVAERFSVTRGRIRQIEAKAQRFLRGEVRKRRHLIAFPDSPQNGEQWRILDKANG